MNIKKHFSAAAAFVLALVLSFGLIGAETLTVNAEETGFAGFSDVAETAWYHDSVVDAYEYGLMLGTSNSTFAPQDTLTREQYIVILARIDGADLTQYAAESPAFEDVKDGSWCEAAINWAYDNHITNGYSETAFGIGMPTNREQVAKFIYGYCQMKNGVPDEASVAETERVSHFKDIDTASEWAVDAINFCYDQGIFMGDTAGNFNPKGTMTRAYAAAVMSRMYLDMYPDAEKVSTWVEYVAPVRTQYEMPTVSAPVVSNDKLVSLMEQYGVVDESNLFYALESINTTYAAKLTSSQKSGTLVFFFEGVGYTSSTYYRGNAVVVVVKNGNIVYYNNFSSTLPDFPFDPSKNSGSAMPTIVSGIYDFTTCNHRNKYAALKILSDKVIRFSDQTSWYESVSIPANTINIHRRSKSGTVYSTSYADSAGCLLVGHAGTGSDSEYAKFIKAVGIVDSSATGASTYTTKVTGTVVIDRTYAYSYLRNIGYPADALAKLCPEAITN